MPVLLLCRGPWAALPALLLAAGAARAQADSVAAAAGHRRLGFSLVLDNRNSFVQASAVRIIGLNAGVVLPGQQGRWRLGLAGYTLRRNYAELYTYTRKGRVKDTFQPTLRLSYLTPNVAYTFLRRRYFELSVPLDVGLGRSHYTVQDENGKTTADERGLFVPAEIGLGVLLKPTRWVGLSAAVGYRKSLKEISYKEDFDGWYYSYRLNLFVGNLWRDWRRHCRKRPVTPDDFRRPGIE